MKNFNYLFLFFLLLLFQIHAQEEPKLGLVFNDEEYEAQSFKEPELSFLDESSSLPSSYSLKAYVPIIGNQGSYGTCVGWSTSYYAKTIAEAKRDNITSKQKITERTYSPVYTYLHSNVKGDFNCKKGAYIDKALASLKINGVPFYTDLSVDCSSGFSNKIHSLARMNKIKEFTPIFHSYDSNMNKARAIKKSLSNGYPVVMGINTYSSLNNSSVYIPTGSFRGGHAVAVIGYDDDISWNIRGRVFKGGIEIANSWGTNRHNGGYFWIPYDFFDEVVKYGYELIPEKKKRLDIEKSSLSGELNFSLDNGKNILVRKSRSTYKNSIPDSQIDAEIGERPGEKIDGSIGYYICNTSYPKNEQFSLDLKINKPAYVYMLTSDSNDKNGVLFPKTGISSYVSSPSRVRFPRTKGNYYFLGGDVNYDRFITIFSNEKIDINSVVNKLDKINGNLNDKLYAVFGDKLINKEDLNLNSTKVSFNTKFKKGSVAILVLEIKRTN